MTLGNFFTPTEMSNGLTAPARVQELISTMQKEQVYVVNENSGEKTRQWSAVASAITATENKECLELFIQLDGLCFIDTWLKDAQKFVSDDVEELITCLLLAIERLRVDNDKSASSGIKVTVKSLLDHESSKVQERARTLFDSWEEEKADGVGAVLVGPDEKVETLLDDGTRVTENLVGENGKSEECEENVCKNNTDTGTSDQNLDGHNHRSPPLLKPVGEDGEVDISSEVVSAIGVHNSAHDTCDGQTGAPVLEPVTYLHDIQQDTNSEKLCKPLEEKTSCSGIDAGNTGSGSDLQRQSDIKDERKSSSHDASSTLLDDSSRLHEHTIELPKTILSDVDVIGGDDKEVSDEIDKEVSDESDKVDSDESDEADSDESDKGDSDESEDDMEFEQPLTATNDYGLIGKKGVDIELEDYGMIDPLEVARQVAIEVGREVEESSSSSSEKIQASKIADPDRPDSMSAVQCQEVESSREQEVAGGTALLTEDPITNSEAAGLKTEKVMLEEGTDAEKGLCDFDLNLEVFSDNINDPVSSASISVVSASKAAAAPGMPVAPLEFEGALGWKGSASTSAFRPASPRRIPQTAVSSDSSIKRQQGWSDFDLNVAQKSADVKQVPLPAVSPKKSVRLELDLNCASEEGEAPSDNWRMEGRLFLDRNGGHWSQSPSSSSSSKHLSSHNFDLNDQPSFLNDSSDLSFFKKPTQSASGRIKSDNSVVSIMGMKVEVKRDDVLQSFPFPNGRTAENAVDVNIARSGGVLGMGSPFLYAPPAFSYNGGMVPGSHIPFSSAMFGPGVGPIPYMVDSRGAPVVPQLLGSASAMPPSFAQQPFLISMANAPIPNGVGPPRTGLDLNILEGGNRDPPGVLRQFFNQRHARSIDEHFRTSSQPSTSSHAGEKRKEPDGGWEPYPFRHHPPPWK